MKRHLLFLVLLLPLCLFSCKSYTEDFDMASLSALYPDVNVFNDNPYIVVMPQDVKGGIVFYPGGLVEYQSYLPLMMRFADKGYACFIVQMPYDFAFMDKNAAIRIRKRYSEITEWYMAGHSLGGAMAASFAASHSQMFEGLILLAAYSTSDLSKTGLRVISIYGSEDGVLNREKYEKNKKNLPSDFAETVIAGGNHGQFGNYGVQKGDGEAEITWQEQQDLTCQAVSAFLSGSD